jgi:phosphoribosylanthranilate isomerase
MIGDIQLKVCGITSAEDARMAEGVGADYLGFIVHALSPRYVSLEQFAVLAPRVTRKKVIVCVMPSAAEIESFAAAGADFIQVHYPPEMAFKTLQAWSQAAGPHRLWLAPRLPPPLDVPSGWLPLGDTFLLDTFDPEKFGGTGQTGDWKKFARHRRAHPGKTWILSGGLAPDNIAGALRESGAAIVDVNSGVEVSPGVKDRAKLQAFADAIGAIRTQ